IFICPPSYSDPCLSCMRRSGGRCFDRSPEIVGNEPSERFAGRVSLPDGGGDCAWSSDTSLIVNPHSNASSTYSPRTLRATCAVGEALGMNFFKRIARRVRAGADAGMSTAEYAV